MGEEKKFYLTQEGLERIKKEYQELAKIRNLKTKEEVPATWHSQDLNPEYLSYREDLNLLEVRLAELENVLKNAKLIEIPSKGQRGIINLGATVVVEVEGQADEFKIVGSLEANPSLGRISNDSPVGRALLGHQIGDEVMVSSPIRTVYKIKKIKYLSS